MMPMQKPHPPIWIPGVVSPESVTWAARHQYPYIALAPPLDLISEIYELYDKVAAEEGFTPTQDHRGYAVRVNVSDSDEKAFEEGKNFYWQQGTSFGTAPRHWQSPPGYMTRAAAQSGRATRRETTRNIPDVTPGGPSLDYQEAHATHQIVTGNPDTVIKKLKEIVDIVDPATLVLWGREGPMKHDTAMKCIDLLSQEVIPAIKEYVPTRAR